MPKSRIIKDLANGKADIEIALNQLFLLASDICDSELIKWTENELQGYSSNIELPEYRKCKSIMFRYSGITGRYHVKNVSLQPDVFQSDKLKAISIVNATESIRTIKDYAERRQEMVRDLSWLAGEVFERSGGHIQATTISQVLPSSMYTDIIAAIKQKTIQKLIELENQYGNLDNLEIQNEYDPENVAFWNNINDRIKNQTKELYTQCFFGPAAERAVREVETKLREMFRELKPGNNEPSKIGDIIGALLSENGVFNYCDLSTQDGKNYCRGFTQLVQGLLTAYRNPLSHKNHELTKRKAFELISLSSMIMETLEQDPTQ